MTAEANATDRMMTYKRVTPRKLAYAALHILSGALSCSILFAAYECVGQRGYGLRSRSTDHCCRIVRFNNASPRKQSANNST